MDALVKPAVAVVDEDPRVPNLWKALLHPPRLAAWVFSHSGDSLRGGRLAPTGCLITDVRMSGISGLDLQPRVGEQPGQL
jgi:FixJ family two-component response regulator